jgi:ankyrin repeat protein
LPPNFLGNLRRAQAGSTALHTAATSGNAPVARLLLATLHGEQLASAANVQGRTPLHLAALFGHEGVVRALMERKADVSAADQVRSSQQFSRLLQWVGVPLLRFD